MFDVFISYSRKDYVDDNNQVIPGNVISKIKDVLTSAGISFWFDEEGIYHGDSFAPIIAKNIKAAKIFLFISSVNSNKSMWTSAEIATAHAYHKKIIPFKYDDSIYHESVILYIAPLDYVEYYKNPSKSMSRLLDSIKSYLDQVKKEENRIREEQENQARQAQEKKKREEDLRQLREQMSSVRNKREGLLNRIVETEAVVSSLKMELSSLDNAYKDLQRKESSLIDNGFDERMVSVFSGSSDTNVEEKKEKVESEGVFLKKKDISAIERVFNNLKQDWLLMPVIFRIWFVISLIGMVFCWRGVIIALKNGLVEDIGLLGIFIIPLAVIGILRFSCRNILGAIEMILSCIALIPFTCSGVVWFNYFETYGLRQCLIILIWLVLPLFKQNKTILYKSFTFCGESFWQIWERPMLYIILIVLIITAPFFFAF